MIDESDEVLFCCKLKRYSDGKIAARWISENMTDDNVGVHCEFSNDLTIKWLAINFETKDNMTWEVCADVNDFFVATRDEDGEIDFVAQKECPHCDRKSKNSRNHLIEDGYDDD